MVLIEHIQFFGEIIASFKFSPLNEVAETLLIGNALMFVAILVRRILRGI